MNLSMEQLHRSKIAHRQRYLVDNLVDFIHRVNFPKYISCNNYLLENEGYTLKTLIFGRNVALHILIINQAIRFVQIQVDMEKDILRQCRNISSNK